VRLKGAGHQLGFDQYVIDLPELAVVEPRFTTRVPPTDAEIIEVLGLYPGQEDDPRAVKGRYRQLVRQLHPDRAGHSEGNTSRFLEVQACYEAWKRRHG
jgi:hypothetical protein